MPIVKLHIAAHVPLDKVRALADAVHAALVATCDVPQTDRFQLITRYDAAHRVIDPTFPDLARTADASIVEIMMRSGRTDDQKRGLYRHIAEHAARGGWRADDIMIALSENTLANWSFGGGIAQYARG